MKSKVKRRRAAAEIAVNLVARNVLQGLRKLNWASWQKNYASKAKNLDKVIVMLTRLSREALLREKFREEMRTPTGGKRIPTRRDLTDITGVNLI
jgi:hypothetical protein